MLSLTDFLSLPKGVANIHYMNEALALFDALLVVPIFLVWWSAVAIVGGGVIFDDFSTFSDLDYAMFLTGCALNFAGVVTLSFRPSVSKTEGGPPNAEKEGRATPSNKVAPKLSARKKRGETTRDRLSDMKRRSKTASRLQSSDLVAWDKTCYAVGESVPSSESREDEVSKPETARSQRNDEKIRTEAAIERTEAGVKVLPPRKSRWFESPDGKREKKNKSKKGLNFPSLPKLGRGHTVTGGHDGRRDEH